MEVSPSLNSQVLELSKEDDNQILCLSVITYKPKTLTALCKVTENSTANDIEYLLPFNLKPLAVACLKPGKEEAAKQVAKNMGLSVVCRFDMKNETWTDIGQGSELIKAKEDVFLESILLGFSVEMRADQLSTSQLTRKCILWSGPWYHTE